MLTCELIRPPVISKAIADGVWLPASALFFKMVSRDVLQSKSDVGLHDVQVLLDAVATTPRELTNKLISFIKLRTVDAAYTVLIDSSEKKIFQSHQARSQKVDAQ
uniref:Uncharacterized protein n=1 Tax=Peronospora matthiolae TaxID=2874970 RepID=A0AAV1TSB0_9STRA